MAIIIAAQSGFFSATTTWIGATVPTPVDEAVANGFTVTITDDITVLSIRNDAAGVGATASGVFVMNTSGVTLNATYVVMTNTGAQTLISVTAPSGTCTIRVTNDVIMQNVVNATFISHNGNCNLTTNGNFYGNPASNVGFSNVVCISKTSSGLLTHNGNIRAGNSSSAGNAGCHGISNSNGAVKINGNVQGNLAGGGTCIGVLMAGTSSSLTIVGDVFGGISSAGISVGAGTITITGNVTGGAQNGISTSSGGVVRITGNVTGGNGGVGISQSSGTLIIIGSQLGTNAAAVSFTSNGPLEVTGIPTAGGTSPAIVSTSTGVVQMSGPFINNAGVQAVQATRMFLSTTSTFWRINTAAGVQRQFSTTDYVGGYPGTQNVRDGVVFGQLGEFTGELIIPPTGSVRKDVPVDNTVGTAELTAADFLAAIDASTSGIGLRLKNVATVASVGAQITGFTNN